MAFKAHIKAILEGEINLHISSERANSYHGVAQADFGAVEGIAPVVNRLDIDARGIAGVKESTGTGKKKDYSAA
jgi:hypothetical protein